jgi:hypothetical protein
MSSDQPDFGVLTVTPVVLAPADLPPTGQEEPAEHGEYDEDLTVTDDEDLTVTDDEDGAA